MQGKSFLNLILGDSNTLVWGVIDSSVSLIPQIGLDGESSGGGTEKLNEPGFSIS